MRFPTLFAVALALAGCATLSTTPLAGTAQPRVPGMVSAADPRAAEAGAAILRQGGSATDAAMATLIALTVVEPESSGIGGGSFLVERDAKGTITTYDARETAPHAATGEWWLKNGQAMPFEEQQPGGKSVGVPGNIRMVARAHQDHGKLPWRALFQPAIMLARDGFLITPRLHGALDEERTIGALNADARALYYDAKGEPLPIGTRIRNPALARFLAMIADRGPDAFYVGPNAQAIVGAVNGAAHNPSPMTVGDVASYDAKPRPPVCGMYRGYRLCGMGPPSSGATTVFATLKMLERFDLARLGPNSPVAWHLIAESMRLAYADRDQYLADGEFIFVPVAGLTDPAYLAARSALISPDKTMQTVVAGTPAGASRVLAGVQPTEHGTSHMVATDSAGNVASITSTIESGFGSGLMVNGYYLNNELTDFSTVPTRDGLPVANRVEGGKRPRSSMAPTIVIGPDGHVRLAVGAAGGATIPAQVLKAIIGVIDWRLSAQQAIALPVLFSPGETIYLEQGTGAEAMIPALTALGHTKVIARPPGYKANAIEWVEGRWVGAADPRSEGVAVAQ